MASLPCPGRRHKPLGGRHNRMSDRDFYKVLQVDPEADHDVIAAAYRALAGKLKPDRELTGVHQVRLAELDRAFAVLSDPAQRRDYDEQRERRLVAVGPGDDGNDGWDAIPRLAQGALSERVQAGYKGARVANMVLDFGRYAGWTLGELARQDPDYLRWLARHSSGIRYRSAILRLLSETETNRTPLHVQR
jgi:curved DNA-binding protein CbpA